MQLAAIRRVFLATCAAAATAVLCGVSSAPQAATPDLPADAWSPALVGVELRRCEFRGGDEPVRGVAARIDLSAAGVRPHATPANGDRLLETDAETTSGFLRSAGLQFAVNTHFFLPVSQFIPRRDLVGLSIAGGEVVSPWEAKQPDCLLLRPDAPPEIAFGRPESLEGVEIALAGTWLVREGVARDIDDSARHPRTAVGVDDAGRLIFLVIDGRRPGHSVGATLHQTARRLVELGVVAGLNLDGGGSTAMAIAGEGGGPILLNRPSGDAERLNGSHFGLFAAPVSDSASPTVVD